MSRTPNGRLPSFKGKRDLSLGTTGGSSAGGASKFKVGGAKTSDANKKKFVPNLVGRAKDAAGASIKKEEKSSPLHSTQHIPVNKRDASGRRGDGRDLNQRHHKPKEYIQTMGSVFSDGLNSEGIKRKGFGSGGGGGGGGESGGGQSRAEMQKPILKNQPIKIDKEAEEARLQALLKDDFLADDLAMGGTYVPVQLPMVDTGKLFKKEEEEEIEGDDEDDPLAKSNLVRKKRANRIEDSDDEEDAAMKVDADSNKSGVKSVIQATKKDQDEDLSFPDLVRRQKGDLLFIQLPDHLPGISTIKKEPEKEKSADGAAAGPSTAKGEEAPKTAPADKTNIPSCTLAELPEGYLGKIQIRQSGRSQLRIGEDLLDIDLGTQVGFLQDLVAIRASSDAPNEIGEMTVMGHVKHRMVLTPDWDQLFEKHLKSKKEAEEDSGSEDEQSSSSS